MITHEYRVELNRMMLHERYGNLSKWQQLGMDALDKYAIVLEPDSVCWQRTHAHTETRIVCKAELPKSRSTLFLGEYPLSVGSIIGGRCDQSLKNSGDDQYCALGGVSLLALGSIYFYLEAFLLGNYPLTSRRRYNGASLGARIRELKSGDSEDRLCLGFSNLHWERRALCL